MQQLFHEVGFIRRIYVTKYIYNLIRVFLFTYAVAYYE